MTDTVEQRALAREQLLSTYRMMRAIREFEERVHAEFATGVPADAAGGPAVETAGVGGRRICYAGAGRDGDVVLLVHGYGGDRNSWLFLQEPLAARYRVCALDLPGHGTSAKDVGDGSVGVLAGSVAGAVRHLIDGAGHMPHMERPAEVQAAIEETLARAT